MRAGSSCGIVLAIAAALPLAAGCFPCVTTTRTGALLPDERLAALKGGRATRREVLEWFGPPTVVARQGDGPLPVPDVVYRRTGGTEVPAAEFFARFASANVAPGDVVYHYRAHEVRTSGGGVVLLSDPTPGILGSSKDAHREDRLWILIDDVTGRVKAHVHEGPARDAPAREEEQ